MLAPNATHPLDFGCVTAKFCRQRIRHFAHCGPLSRRLNSKGHQILRARRRLGQRRQCHINSRLITRFAQCFQPRNLLVTHICIINTAHLDLLGTTISDIRLIFIDAHDHLICRINACLGCRCHFFDTQFWNA